MNARTRRSHAPKPTLGEICTVSWRGREPSRTPEPSPRRRLRRTPNASTRIFGHSSARSNRRDAEREASCTSMASSVFDLPTAVSLLRNRQRVRLGRAAAFGQPMASTCAVIRDQISPQHEQKPGAAWFHVERQRPFSRALSCAILIRLPGARCAAQCIQAPWLLVVSVRGRVYAAR